MTKTDRAMVTINRTRLLERFLRYVAIDTAADPKSESYPSSDSQRDFGKMLLAELQQMSADDAHQDDNALVYATVPATNGGGTPTVALLAHMDTSPESPSVNIQPQVIPAYAGGDITLASGATISPNSCEELGGLVGKTLITTDGTTLLGGDDKAGVAIIMELAHTLIENPNLMHGDVRLLFTCDEEIGRGTAKIDLEKLGAMVGYTVDGGGSGVVDVETFSADAATVRFVGHNIHPAIAKNRMINAVRAASAFVASLPLDRLSPESTDQRDGFLHPYTIRGGVGEATVEVLLRSFESEDLAEFAKLIEKNANEICDQMPGLKVEVETHRQYRNLREGLADLPEAVGLAERAFENLGRTHETAIIRGGTDGSQLTEMGLPTPNLSSGQHNIHAVTEFACLDEMVEATEHLIELLRLWGELKS